MDSSLMESVGAIVLAAGQGTRMNSKTRNKVMLTLSGKPILSYTIELLESMRINPIVVVVGFGKEEIIQYFGNRVLYAVQSQQIGTGHAAHVGLERMLYERETENTLLVNGDDSYNYSPAVLSKLVQKHIVAQADVSFITIELENPFGIGRVVRSAKGRVEKIVEEKNATDKQKKITEVSPQCWLFKTSFLKEYLPKIKKDPVTDEYYVNSLLALAADNGKIVADMPIGKISWRGINRPEELEEARKLLKQKNG